MAHTHTHTHSHVHMPTHSQEGVEEQYHTAVETRYALEQQLKNQVRKYFTTVNVEMKTQLVVLLPVDITTQLLKQTGVKLGNKTE